MSQTIYGPAVQTDNMHNVQISGVYDPNVYGEYANSWFKKYILSISAPPGWHFTGTPRVNLVGPAGGESAGDAQAAFGWNRFDVAHDRVFATQSTPNYVVMTVWAGSHPMILNLACDAVQG